MFVFILGAIVLAVGLVGLVNAFRERQVTPQPPAANRIRRVIIGSLVSLVGISMMGTALPGDPAGKQAPPRASTAVAAAPSGRTDIQNLAIMAGVSENDAELTRQYARLQTLCPPANASVGDMVINLKQMVLRESGRDMALIDVMRQLATAQEGGQTAGMTCAETGGMLAELLIKGL